MNGSVQRLLDHVQAPRVEQEQEDDQHRREPPGRRPGDPVQRDGDDGLCRDAAVPDIPGQPVRHGLRQDVRGQVGVAEGAVAVVARAAVDVRKRDRVRIQPCEQVLRRLLELREHVDHRRRRNHRHREPQREAGGDGREENNTARAEDGCAPQERAAHGADENEIHQGLHHAIGGALDERPGRRREPEDQAQEKGDGQHALPGALGGRPASEASPAPSPTRPPNPASASTIARGVYRPLPDTMAPARATKANAPATDPTTAGSMAENDHSNSADSPALGASMTCMTPCGLHQMQPLSGGSSQEPPLA